MIPLFDLPGPGGFSRALGRLLLHSEDGLAAAVLPTRCLAGFEGALVRRLEEDCDMRVIEIPHLIETERRPILTELALRAAGSGHGITTMARLMASSQCAGSVFVVDLRRPEVWNRWRMFLATFASEFRRAAAPSPPRLLALVSGDLSAREIASVFGSSHRSWRGQVTPADTRLFVADRLGSIGNEALVDRMFEEVVVHLAGWDLDFAERLIDGGAEDFVDPWSVLDALTPESHPLTWAEGQVDEWGEGPFVSTLACLARGDRETVKRRIWLGRVRAGMAFVGEVAGLFVRVYGAILESEMPYEAKLSETKTRTITSIHDLEIQHIARILRHKIALEEASFLIRVAGLRNELSHYSHELSFLEDISSAWVELRERHSWQGYFWPRCGQKLVLLVGPPGSGKSARARARYSEEIVVSYDEICGRMGLGRGDTENETVFAELRRLVRDRLSRGESVVVDAMNIDRASRLNLVRIPPGDIPVVYEIIDRPLEEKLEAAHREDHAGQGTQALAPRPPDVVEAYDARFREELARILRGDGCNNVEVIDLRSEKTVRTDIAVRRAS